MIKLKKEWQYAITIGALLVIGFVAASIFERQPASQSDGQDIPTAAETPQSPTQTPPSPSPTPPRAGAPKKDTPFTYQEVVEQYEGYRIQFDTECIASPSKVTYKNRTKVMFDNRAPQQRIISLDGRGYKIGPYGFIILELSNATLPHTINVGCEQKYNVAQIFLQS